MNPGFPFTAFALARRSATARKREDKLHGNDLSSYNIPISYPVINEPINTMQQGCHVKRVIRKHEVKTL